MAEVFYFHVQEDRSIKYKLPEPIMQEDKDVATWRFRIPKALNQIDMSAWSWWFVYVNAKGQEYSELLTLTDDIDEPASYSTADYDIDYGISKFPGSFSFALEAISAQQGGEIDGEWHTKTYKHKVDSTLQGNQAEYAETESDIISALMQEVRNKVNQLVCGATPLPVNLKSLMTDHDKVYLYTGSETGESTGYWYYYNGTDFVPGGQYGAGVQIDSTLSQSGQAADAGAVGDKFDNIEGSLNDTNADVYSAQAMSASATSNGWRLNDSNGLVTSNSSYKIVKYQVTAGERVKVISDDRFQFQTVASVPSSGSSNRVGATYSAGTYYLTVPATATYLICSALISGGVADAYALSSKVDILSEQIGGINANVDNIKNVLDTQTIEPVNKIDPSKLTTGRYLYNGTFENNASYKTTDYIAVNAGDVIAFYKKISAAVNVERNNGERLALFDENKTYLGVSGQYPIKTDTYYTVENASAKYIRLSYSASLGDVELTINQTVNEFSEYVPATLDSIRLTKIERNIGATASSKIIDCWGDSRTDMNDDGTSFCDYLQTLLGDTWTVQNRGVSGQASGQVSARFGSNEVFLTLENNQIPASGNALITAWKVSTGTDTNLRGGDATYGVHGIINGVSGKYIHTTGGNINFVRDYNGTAVKVKPRTKIIPDPYFNAEHCQILWCGKNDFSYAYPNVVSGITGNYNGMVGKIPHDKFIILGETNGIGDTYLPGHSNRGYVDSINAYLAQKYPDNFIDIQAELIANGLTLEGITPTSADTSNIANGWIPDSLMADETHPNQYGREAIAKIIYAWMQEKGWI